MLFYNLKHIVDINIKTHRNIDTGGLMRIQCKKL